MQYTLGTMIDFLTKLQGTPTPMLPPAPGPEVAVCEAPEARAWERQDGEEETEWLRFKAFRDAPRPRKVVRPGAGRTQDLYDLAGKWRWFERVAQFDRYMDRVHQAVIESFVKQDAKEIAAEHMSMLRDARELVSIEIARILERAKDSKIDGSIKVPDLIRLMDFVIAKDRLVRGESTENVQPVGNLSEMTIEDLRNAKALIDKMNKPAAEVSPLRLVK